MPRPFLVCALIAILCLGTGCAAAVAGAAGYGAMKVAGNGSQRAYAADCETTWAATLDSMREAGYPVDPSASYTDTRGALAIGGAKVRVQTASDGMTHVLVRVGTFDNNKNRERARVILDGIAARVMPPTPPVEPTPAG